MYLNYLGTLSGSSMAKAIKDFARAEFDHTIIDESQIDEVIHTLQEYADKMATLHTRWKPVKIERHDGRCCEELGQTDLHWVVVDEESILTIKKARCNYAPF